MAMISHEVVGAVPATDELDLTPATQLTSDGPYWVSFIAWVHTADAAAGFQGFAIWYTDPTGVERDFPMDNPVLILSDGSSIFNAPVRVLCRESASSSWRLERSLISGAGNALVSYQLVLTPADDTEVAPISFPE